MSSFYEVYRYFFQAVLVFVSLTGTILFIGARRSSKRKSVKLSSFIWGVTLCNVMTLIFLAYMYDFLKQEFKLTMDNMMITFILYLVSLFLIQTFSFIKTINQTETLMKEYEAPIVLLTFSLLLHFVSLIEMNAVDKLNHLADPFYWSWLISLFLGVIGSIALIVLGTVDLVRVKVERTNQKNE